MRRLISLSALCLAISSGAHAGTITVGSLSVSAQSAAGATASPFLLYNPGTTYIPGNQATAGFVSDASVNMGGATITFSPNIQSPNGGTYAGNTASAKSPFYGTSLANTNYFVAEPSDPVNIAFIAPRISFDLLWGSVDTYNYLTIDFCLKGVCTAGTELTGTEIASAAGIATGGVTSAFVELSETAPFDDIQITSSSIAFEFEPQVVPAPEPITLSVLGSGMAGLALVRRRRRRVGV